MTKYRSQDFYGGCFYGIAAYMIFQGALDARKTLTAFFGFVVMGIAHLLLNSWDE